MALRVGLVGLRGNGNVGYFGLRGLHGLCGLEVVQRPGAAEDVVLSPAPLSATRGTTNSELERTRGIRLFN